MAKCPHCGGDSGFVETTIKIPLAFNVSMDKEGNLSLTLIEDSLLVEDIETWVARLSKEKYKFECPDCEHKLTEEEVKKILEEEENGY